MAIQIRDGPQVPDDQYYDPRGFRSAQVGLLDPYDEKNPLQQLSRRIYGKRRNWLVCTALTAISTFFVVFLVAFAFFPMLAQDMIDKSIIEVKSASFGFAPQTLNPRDVQSPVNMPKYLNMVAEVKNAGSLSAKITFENPIDVYYNSKLLGRITLPTVSVSSGHGEFTTNTLFQVADETSFAAFAMDMTEDSFLWDLRGSARVSALSRSTTVRFIKQIVVPDMKMFSGGIVKPFKFDAANLGIISTIGKPLVQLIVNGADFALSSVVLSNPTNTTFTVQMKGSITNAGPMDSTITFPTPLTVAWQGRRLGTVTMGTINSKAFRGATFESTGSFVVSDQTAMADFSGYLINNPSFVWQVSTSDLSVKALGIQFTGVDLQKYVTLDGCNGFKNAVRIESFDLPSNDPSGDGITLTANTFIANPSQVGFNLNGAGLAPYFNGVYLGPLSSVGNFNLPPKATANIQMTGRLVRQTTPEGLAAVKSVFVNYLSGQSSTVTVRGVSGSGPDGQVGWLTTGFQTLAIENVVLPGPATAPKLISSITMKDMQLDFTQEPYAPPTGSQQVEAQLQSPFGFPISVSSLSMEVDAAYEGTNVAHLSVPTQSATTSGSGLVTTQFSNIPFTVYDNAHDLFAGFVTLLTAYPNVSFSLAGTSNAVANLAVGDIELDGISFNVPTELSGLNNLGGVANILSVSVTGATADYLIVDLQLSLNNPSQISVVLGDVVFYVVMDEFSAEVGEVYVTGLSLVPGVNQFTGQMHMHSSNQQALAQLLSNYMTAAVTPLTVLGKTSSTAIVPLQQALATTHLTSSLTGIEPQLVAKADVIIPLESVLGGPAFTVAYIHNLIDTQIGITGIKASIVAQLPSYPNQEIGVMDVTLDSPFYIAPGQIGATPRLTVNLIKDVNIITETLTLFTEGKLFVEMYQNVTLVIGDGFSGGLYYYQSGVGVCLFITDGTSTFPMGPCPVDDNGNPVATSLAKTAKVSTSLPADIVAQLPAPIQSLYGGAPATTTAAPVETTTAAATSEAAPTAEPTESAAPAA